jgi:hypothetical protein
VHQYDCYIPRHTEGGASNHSSNHLSALTTNHVQQEATHHVQQEATHHVQQEVFMWKCEWICVFEDKIFFVCF